MQVNNELDFKDNQTMDESLTKLLHFTRQNEGSSISIQKFDYKSVDDLKSILRSTRETLIYISNLDTRHYSDNVIDSLFQLSKSLLLFLDWETDNRTDFLV